MSQPAQRSPPWLPQAACLFKRPAEPCDVELNHAAFAFEHRRQRPALPDQPEAPNRADRAFHQDHGPAGHEQPGTDGAHSLPSPSSMAPTGAIATTPGSSAVRRMTMTPCVCRPICEIAPTAVRSTMPLALMISTSSSGSCTTLIEASLTTRSVTFNVNTPCPARWCIRYSATCVPFPEQLSVTHHH